MSRGYLGILGMNLFFHFLGPMSVGKIEMKKRLNRDIWQKQRFAPAHGVKLVCKGDPIFTANRFGRLESYILMTPSSRIL
jgi:hypothetical protein